MRRDELRAMCREVIDHQHDQTSPSEWSGKCIAFAAIIGALLEELETTESERDAVISACMNETWRAPYRALYDASYRGEMEHGWEWGVRHSGGFVKTREEAVAAVRRAAGLDQAKPKSKRKRRTTTDA